MDLGISLVTVECLPWLPSTLTTFVADPPYFPCFPNWPSALVNYDFGPGITPTTATYCTIINSDCPGLGPALSGYVFLDLDADGLRDPGELGVPGAIVSIAPAGQVAGGDTAGHWQISVPPGDHTITVTTNYPYAQSVAPNEHQASVPGMNDVDSGNDFAVTVTPGIQDLQAFLTATPARPGFDHQLHLTCRNYGTVSVAPELSLQFDGYDTWVSATVPPTSQSGSSASWSLPELAPGADFLITVTLNTSTGAALGWEIGHVLTVGPVATDQIAYDNTAYLVQTVVGSYDPNDKLVVPDLVTQGKVFDPMTWTIRFQNTGTAAAERVILVDSLSEKLDLSAMQFLTSSHPCQWSITDRVLLVEFPGIVLPDSATDLVGSQGFFSFSLRPDLTVLDLDQDSILNVAHIFFDFNDAIVTDPAIFRNALVFGVAEEANAAFNIHPNPALDRVQVTSTRGGGAIDHRLCDATGRTVLQGRVDALGGIDLHGLPAGLYLLHLRQDDERSRLRVVKR